MPNDDPLLSAIRDFFVTSHDFNGICLPALISKFGLGWPDLQKRLAQLVTSRQVIEMATIAGAAANRILDKVGTLTPGKEADIVVLDARNINIWPINNVPGTIVTMMNPRHVRDVVIAGKVVYWKGKHVGWDVDKLLGQIEQARDRVLTRINGHAKSGQLPRGNNSFTGPYRPNFLASCCDKGQNTTSPAYVLRP